MKKTILEQIDSKRKLALLLGISPAILEVAYRGAGRMYRKVPLLKKDGTVRDIKAPRDLLKRIQRAILDQILISHRLPPFLYGFSAKGSIVENARAHAQSEYVLTLDIKDFFPSVTTARVETIFRSFGASGDILKTLTRLSTLNYSLPQGAPTSPYLAALALRVLDSRLLQLCKANGLIYTRYFDDITISGEKRAHEILETVVHIIKECGYMVHTKREKLRQYSPNEPRIVTGIEIIAGALRVPNVGALRKYLEALIDSPIAALRSSDPVKEQQSILGKISFVKTVDRHAAEELMGLYAQIKWP